MRFRTAQRKKMVAIAAALVACMMMAGCGASSNTVDISSMEFNPQGKTIKQIAAALESGENHQPTTCLLLSRPNQQV